MRQNTNQLITIGTALVMLIFTGLWLSNASATVTFIGAIVAICVIVWLARLEIEEKE